MTRATVVAISLFLLFSLPIHAQILEGVMNVQAGGLTLTPGWTLVQQFAGPDCSAGTSTCTVKLDAGTGFTPLPTLAGTVQVLVFIGGNSNVTITSAYGCVSQTSCTSGNATETFSLVAGSACHVYNSGNDDMDLVYLNSASDYAGTNTWTINLSGNATSSFTPLFHEILPPSGYSGTFDGCATTTAAASASQTGATLSPTGTDALLQIYDSNNYWPNGALGWSSPYFTIYGGNAICLDCTSGTAPTVTLAGSTFWTDIGVAFKSSAGTYTAPKKFKLVQYETVGSDGGTESCSSSGCSMTIATPTAGDLLVLVGGGANNAGYVTSVSGNGTWTCPNAGKAVSGAATAANVCYNLSATASTSTLTIDTGVTGTYGFGLWEVSRTSGSFTLDDVEALQNSASAALLYSGPALSAATGTDDVRLDVFVPQGSYGGDENYYGVMPMGPGQGFFNIIFSTPLIGNTMVLDTNQFGATTWAGESGTTANGTIAIAFK